MFPMKNSCCYEVPLYPDPRSRLPKLNATPAIGGRLGDCYLREDRHRGRRRREYLELGGVG